MNDLTLLLSSLLSISPYATKYLYFSHFFLQYSYKKNHYVYAFYAVPFSINPARGAVCVYLSLCETKNKFKVLLDIRSCGYCLCMGNVSCVCMKKERKRQVPCKVILYLLFNNSNLIFSFLLLDSDCTCSLYILSSLKRIDLRLLCTFF